MCKPLSPCWRAKCFAASETTRVFLTASSRRGDPERAGEGRDSAGPARRLSGALSWLRRAARPARPRRAAVPLSEPPPSLHPHRLGREPPQICPPLSPRGSGPCPDGLDPSRCVLGTPGTLPAALLPRHTLVASGRTDSSGCQLSVLSGSPKHVNWGWREFHAFLCFCAFRSGGVRIFCCSLLLPEPRNLFIILFKKLGFKLW